MSNDTKPRPLSKLWNGLDALMAFAAVAIVAIVIYQIFARAGGMSIRWTEELARLVCIWAVFLGVPAMMLRRSLIRIEFFFDHLPLAVRRIVLWAEFVITAAVLVFLAVLTARQVGETWDQTSAGLVWPMGIFTLPIALGAVLGLVVLWHMRRQLLQPGRAHEQDDEVARDTA